MDKKIKDAVAKLNETINIIKDIELREFAEQRIGDDGLYDEVTPEEREEAIKAEMSEIEQTETQDTDENRIREVGYIEGYSQAYRTIYVNKNNYEKLKGWNNNNDIDVNN